MRLLVAGGAGYIGSVTAALLLERGHEVVVVDDLSSGNRAAVPKEVLFIQADVGDQTVIRELLDWQPCDAVLDFTGRIVAPESVADPAGYLAANVAKTLLFLQEVVKKEVPFVFSSSAAVYGAPRRPRVTEATPLRPINPYGLSKMMIEEALLWYARLLGLRSVSLRYFNAAGAWRQWGEAHEPETHLIPRVLQVALGRSPAVELYGTDYPTADGTALRDYIHVVDLAEAHILAAERLVGGASLRAAYNVGAGRAYSVRQVIAVAEGVTGQRLPVIERPRRPGDPPQLLASIAAAQRDLGWRPARSDLAEIVASAWEWQRRHVHGYLSG